MMGPSGSMAVAVAPTSCDSTNTAEIMNPPVLLNESDDDDDDDDDDKTTQDYHDCEVTLAVHDEHHRGWHECPATTEVPTARRDQKDRDNSSSSSSEEEPIVTSLRDAMTRRGSFKRQRSMLRRKVQSARTSKAEEDEHHHHDVQAQEEAHVHWLYRKTNPKLQRKGSTDDGDNAHSGIPLDDSHKGGPLKRAKRKLFKPITAQHDKEVEKINTKRKARLHRMDVPKTASAVHEDTARKPKPAKQPQQAKSLESLKNKIIDAANKSKPVGRTRQPPPPPPSGRSKHNNGDDNNSASTASSSATDNNNHKMDNGVNDERNHPLVEEDREEYQEKIHVEWDANAEAIEPKNDISPDSLQVDATSTQMITPVGRASSSSVAIPLLDITDHSTSTASMSNTTSKDINNQSSEKHPATTKREIVYVPPPSFGSTEICFDPTAVSTVQVPASAHAVMPSPSDIFSDDCQDDSRQDAPYFNGAVNVTPQTAKHSRERGQIIDGPDRTSSTAYASAPDAAADSSETSLGDLLFANPSSQGKTDSGASSARERQYKEMARRASIAPTGKQNDSEETSEHSGGMAEIAHTSISSFLDSFRDIFRGKDAKADTHEEPHVSKNARKRQEKLAAMEVPRLPTQHQKDGPAQIERDNETSSSSALLDHEESGPKDETTLIGGAMIAGIEGANGRTRGVSSMEVAEKAEESLDETNEDSGNSSGDSGVAKQRSLKDIPLVRENFEVNEDARTKVGGNGSCGVDGADEAVARAEVTESLEVVQRVDDGNMADRTVAVAWDGDVDDSNSSVWSEEWNDGDIKTATDVSVVESTCSGWSTEFADANPITLELPRKVVPLETRGVGIDAGSMSDGSHDSVEWIESGGDDGPSINKDDYLDNAINGSWGNETSDSPHDSRDPKLPTGSSLAEQAHFTDRSNHDKVSRQDVREATIWPGGEDPDKESSETVEETIPTYESVIANSKALDTQLQGAAGGVTTTKRDQDGADHCDVNGVATNHKNLSLVLELKKMHAKARKRAIKNAKDRLTALHVYDSMATTDAAYEIVAVMDETKVLLAALLLQEAEREEEMREAKKRQALADAHTSHFYGWKKHRIRTEGKAQSKKSQQHEAAIRKIREELLSMEKRTAKQLASATFVNSAERGLTVHPNDADTAVSYTEFPQRGQVNHRDSVYIEGMDENAQVVDDSVTAAANEEAGEVADTIESVEISDPIELADRVHDAKDHPTESDEDGVAANSGGEAKHEGGTEVSEGSETSAASANLVGSRIKGGREAHGKDIQQDKATEAGPEDSDIPEASARSNVDDSGNFEASASSNVDHSEGTEVSTSSNLSHSSNSGASEQSGRSESSNYSSQDENTEEGGRLGGAEEDWVKAIKAAEAGGNSQNEGKKKKAKRRLTSLILEEQKDKLPPIQTSITYKPGMEDAIVFLDKIKQEKYERHMAELEEAKTMVELLRQAKAKNKKNKKK